MARPPETSRPSPERTEAPGQQREPGDGAQRPNTGQDGPERDPQRPTESPTPRDGDGADTPRDGFDRPEPGTPEYEHKIDDAVERLRGNRTEAGISGHSDPNTADLARRVPDDGRHFTLDAHMGPDGRVHIGDRAYSPEELADVFRRLPEWDGERPLRLISCDSSDFAAELARRLDVPVTAPRGLAWTDSNGRVFASSIGPDGRPTWPPDGGWDTHHPDRTSSPSSEDGFHPPRDGEDPGGRPEDAEARGENKYSHITPPPGYRVHSVNEEGVITYARIDDDSLPMLKEKPNGEVFEPSDSFERKWVQEKYDPIDISDRDNFESIERHLDRNARPYVENIQTPRTSESDPEPFIGEDESIGLRHRSKINEHAEFVREKYHTEIENNQGDKSKVSDEVRSEMSDWGTARSKYGEHFGEAVAEIVSRDFISEKFPGEDITLRPVVEAQASMTGNGNDRFDLPYELIDASGNSKGFLMVEAKSPGADFTSRWHSSGEYKVQQGHPGYFDTIVNCMEDDGLDDLADRIRAARAEGNVHYIGVQARLSEEDGELLVGAQVTEFELPTEERDRYRRDNS
ncbi:hypothetical protein [Actinopolyspora mortivallis]|uniref:Uncharacterized protein n=1 Tax=Actinopolyspora mortivallis TaxID=33906 RepID=A0A2T0H0Q0_ACTMO|nr:hypothetical protein [Actinopolyspora mortivallis]PRW64934.1 hypothetical protein CEP50_03755 [Actinopolyspora mortivallis]